MNTPFPRQRTRRGMTLLEVLLALSIFSIVCVGLVTALDRSFSAARDRNAADEATRGLANQFALLHSVPLIPGESDLTNDYTASPSNTLSTYHLAVAAVPTLDQKKQPVVGLYRATITARWEEDGQVQTRSVSELVYQP